MQLDGFMTGDWMQVGLVYVDGQKNDVWCDAKKPITDMLMFNDLRHTNDPNFYSVPTCFKLFYQSTAAGSKLMLNAASECLPSALNANTPFFLCE